MSRRRLAELGKTRLQLRDFGKPRAWKGMWCARSWKREECVVGILR
jgi:hypothetical protein